MKQSCSHGGKDEHSPAQIERTAPFWTWLNGWKECRAREQVQEESLALAGPLYLYWTRGNTSLLVVVVVHWYFELVAFRILIVARVFLPRVYSESVFRGCPDKN